MSLNQQTNPIERKSTAGMLILAVSFLAVLLGAREAFASVDVGCEGGAIVANGNVVGYFCRTNGCSSACSKTGAPSAPPRQTPVASSAATAPVSSRAGAPDS